MINEERIRLMTKLAVYEENEGKTALLMSKYNEKDYVSAQKMKSFIWGTISYALIVVLAGFMAPLILTFEMNTKVMMQVGIGVIAGYLLFITIYLILVCNLAKKRYRDGSAKLKYYQSQLDELEKFYESESDFSDSKPEW